MSVSANLSGPPLVEGNLGPAGLDALYRKICRPFGT